MANEEERTSPPVLGVDVSKRRLDAALTGEDGAVASGAFANDPAGRLALFKWAREHGAAQPAVCVESSGGYELDLCEEAHRLGCRVLLVSALRTASFRKTLHLRNKTDGDDARLLCRFALQMALRPWTPPAPWARQLKELVGQRVHAVRDAAKRRVLLDRQRTAAGRRNVARTLRALEREAAKITAEIHRLIDGTPELDATRRLLTSIPGVGPATAAEICAAAGDLGRFDDVRQFAAFAGIHPARRQSGTSLDRARVAKAGDRNLRSALFMAALSARQYNPVVRDFAERLLRRRPDLAKKQVICACAHKLARIVFGVLKSGRPFDPGAQTGSDRPADTIPALGAAGTTDTPAPQPGWRTMAQILRQALELPPRTPDRQAGGAESLASTRLKPSAAC